MAIIIEQRNKSGIISIILWLIMIVILGAGGYYIFFTKPELLPFTPSPALESAEQLSQISLDPSLVIASSKFTALKSYVTAAPARPAGRANPFLEL